MKRIEDFIEENMPAMLADLSKLVEIESVEGPALPGAPYGAAVRQALDTSLAIAKRLGLSVCLRWRGSCGIWAAAWRW